MRDECLKKWVYVEKDDGGDRFLNGADLGCGYPSGKPSDLHVSAPLLPPTLPPPLTTSNCSEQCKALIIWRYWGAGRGGGTSCNVSIRKDKHTIEIS